MTSFFDGLPATDASALTGFAGNRIDREAEHRTAESVAAAQSDRDARVYLFRGDKALLRGTDPLFTVAEADALGADALGASAGGPNAGRGGAVLLGYADGAPRFAALLPDSVAIDESRITLTDLRSLAIAAEIAPAHLGALAQARSLTLWNAKNGFCATCGTGTAMASGGYRRDCPNCKAQHFPRTDPVVIMLAIDEARDRALLGRSARFNPGMYSCLAGFVEHGETIEDAVRRETREESGIRIGRVRYHASQPWPFAASLMIGCHGEALSFDITRDEAELEDCRWFSRAEVRQMLAGTHPEKITAPTKMAIAHHIVKAWADAK
jgi:NAD+ diphosphatase